MEILKAPAMFDSANGTLKGNNISCSERRLADLSGIFEDHKSFEQMDPEQIVYAVETHDEANDAAGGLYFGVSHIYPGKVGNEYFMTKGHFHKKQDSAEYYWGITGTGILLMMNTDRKSWIEEIVPGSLHYIPGYAAHRIVNTGSELLTVGACWPSDAGHDYQSIIKNGFSVRIKEINGAISTENFT